MKYIQKIIIASLFVIMLNPLSVMAQEVEQEELKPARQFVEWTIQKSLFMTPNEITSILQARQGLLAPEEAFDEENQLNPTDTSPRVLSLAGIVYVNRKDWTIWLNGERVTPANIPDRVVALTVKRDRIHMKWLDIREQRVVVVTMRPHHRFDLDTNLMMPGT